MARLGRSRPIRQQFRTVRQLAPAPKTYFVSPGGSDGNDGLTTGTAWQTVSKVNSTTLNAGDTVRFEGGQTFSGTLLFIQNAGTSAQPITFNSYGTGRATLATTTSAAVYAEDVGGLAFVDLILDGPGGATSHDGLVLFTDVAGRRDYIRITNVDVSGYRHGVSIGGSGTGGFSDVVVDGCDLHDNLINGLIVYGPTFSGSNYANSNVTVQNTSAYNNTGDSGNTTDATGSGILLGSVDTGLVDLCDAHDNGASNGASATGPIGIWTYDSTAVTIRRCVSYSNSSGTNADGGGFDLDQNTSNCVIEYCLAYSNKGPGYLLFGAASTTTSTGNTVRYCLGWGNGTNTASQFAELYVFGPVQNSQIYNNTFVSRDTAGVDPYAFAIEDNTTDPVGIKVRNNNLVSQTAAVVFSDDTYATSAVHFQGNNYYTTSGSTIAAYGGSNHTTLAAWRAAISGQEQISGVDKGSVGDPLLANGTSAPTVTDPTVLTGANGLKLLATSPVAKSGLDLNAEFGTSVGTRDYFNITLTSLYSVGGHEQNDAPAGVATTTVTAHTPAASVAPSAGNALASVAAQSATTRVSPVVGSAAATVAAQTPSPSIRVNAGVATVSVAAQNVTTFIRPSSQAAAVTVAAQTPSPSIRVNTTAAAVTFTANNPTITIGTSAQAGSAAVTFTANDPSRTVAPTSGAAAATVAAQDPSRSISVNAGVATVSVAAQNATVSTTAGTNAAAEAATFALTAQGVTASVATTAGSAAATVTGNGVTSQISSSAGVATYALAANSATNLVSPVVGAASVTFTANNATVSTSGAANAFPTAASISFAAETPSVKVSPTSGSAAVGVAAQSATTTISPTSGSAAVTFTANNATANTAGSGTAFAQSASIAFQAIPPDKNAVARATTAVAFTANNATVTRAGNPTPTAASIGMAAQNPTITIRPNSGIAVMSVVGQNADGVESKLAFAQTATFTATSNINSARVSSTPITALVDVEAFDVVPTYPAIDGVMSVFERAVATMGHTELNGSSMGHNERAVPAMSGG